MRNNIPFTSKQVQDLHYGFNCSGIYPNRRSRRAILQKQNRYKAFGKSVSRVQLIPIIKKGILKFIKKIFHFNNY